MNKLSALGRRAGLALLSATFLSGASACDQPRPVRVRAVQYIAILIGTHSGDPTWQALRAGAARFARDASKLKLEEVLPASATPVAQKVALGTIGDRDRPIAVCVLAIDARVLVQPILRLANQGAHVLLIGDDAPTTRRRAYIGADERAAGQAMGKVLVSVCKASRTLMVVHDNRGDARSKLRHDGLMQELRLHRNVNILRKFDCLGQRAKALRIAYETSERYPGLAGWVLLGDWLDADLPADRPLIHGTAKIVSYGARPNNFHLLDAGRVDALVGVDWEELGFRAIQACYQLLSLSALPVRDYRAPPVVITRENLAEFRKKWAGVATSRPSSRPGKS